MRASLIARLVKKKNPPAVQGRPWFDSWGGKILWRKDRLLTPVFWPGESMDCVVHGVTKSLTDPTE